MKRMKGKWKKKVKDDEDDMVEFEREITHTYKKRVTLEELENEKSMKEDEIQRLQDELDEINDNIKEIKKLK